MRRRGGEKKHGIETLKISSVTFKNGELETSNASKEETKEIMEFVVAHWQAYLDMQIGTLSEHYTDDARRLSGRVRRTQDGKDEIVAGFAGEWEAFERSNGHIAEKLNIRGVEIYFDSNAKTAIIMYWLEIEGGTRWHYDDQALILQGLLKSGGNWQISHHIDAFSLDYDLDEDDYGDAGSFDYDYAYPVKDIQRAVKFYQPILGQPEYSDGKHAIFNVGGSRFILDGSELGGVAGVRTNLPNGYPVIREIDFDGRRSKLKAQKVIFHNNTDERPHDYHGSKMMIVLDLDGNILTYRNDNAVSGKEGGVSGFPLGSSYVDEAKEIATSFVAADAVSLASRFGSNGYWLDSTELKWRGLEDKSTLAKGLKEVYFKRYPYGANGLSLQWTAANVKENVLGKYVIVSYERELRLTGMGNPRPKKSFVTHIFDGTRLLFTLFSDADHVDGMALALDYSGHPVLALQKASDFYQSKLGLGKPYHDEDWRGFWGNNWVLGVYESDIDDDKIPVKNRANGYASFWVRSAEETHAYLQKSGSNFPRIPAINDKAGLESQPGYIQVVSTDSEGNVVVFTEYTGRAK